MKQKNLSASSKQETDKCGEKRVSSSDQFSTAKLFTDGWKSEGGLYVRLGTFYYLKWLKIFRTNSFPFQ
jgi:hypothetical protein